MPAEDAAFETRLFGHALGTERGYACFSRSYDATHLARHPHQNVRTMTLLVTGSATEDRPSYALSLGATFRAKGVDLLTSGGCGSIHDRAVAGDAGAVAHCGVDCDGGAIDVRLKDATSVLVAIPDGARVAAAGNENPSPAYLRRRFGADDLLFRLDRTALEHCLPLGGDDDKAALRHGP